MPSIARMPGPGDIWRAKAEDTSGTLADAINDAIAELTIAQKCLAAYDPDGENWALRRKVRSALDCARLAVADAMVLA